MYLSAALLLGVALAHIAIGSSVDSKRNGGYQCLKASEVPGILKRWNGIFATGAASTVNTAVTVDVTTYDEQVTRPGPYASSRAELFAYLNTPSIGVIYPTSTSVFYFFTCDQIASRFEQNATSTGKDPNITAPAGTFVSYKGVDLLTIDLPTRLVKSATSSSDLLNFYVPLKEKPAAIGLSCN